MSPLLKKAVIVLAGALYVASFAARADYTAVVSPGTVIVTNFQGWGSSLCWWANVVGGYSNRDDYINLAFQQLKLNIVRYNIGGGENPNLTNTITNYRAIMQGFEPSNGVWNWDADANQRWVLRTAVAMGANLVDAFANSPPWWMTVSGSVTGAVGGTNNLQVAYENTFAVYLATVVSNLTVLDGVHFNYVTPMNEPTDAWAYDNGKQEGCHMSASQQSAVVGYLSTQLSLMAVSAGIDAPEDYSEQDSINDLNSYSSGPLASVALVSTHTYSANNPSGLKSLAESMNRPLWVTEYGDGDGTGLTMAQRIHNDITGMGANAWVYWQVVDNAGGWGFLYNPLTTNSQGGFNTSYTINQKFYVMGQYSEFVRPGCNIINVNDSSTLAAYNAADATLVLVTVNTNTTNINVTYNLSAFNSAPAQAAVYQTSSGESLASLPAIPITNEEFVSVIPAQSVTTFIVTFPGLLQPDPYSINLLSYRPIAYWRLRETQGSTTAYEYVGGYAGTYGSATTNGQPGIPNPPFLGMPHGDLGVWMDHSGGTNGFVTTPALNATVSNTTLLCWVYPNGSQNNSEGLVFSRGSGAANGINYAANNSFGYTWANNSSTYDWSSGMAIPTNTWSLLALVITSSNAVGYVFNTNGQSSATNNVANPAEALSAGFTIGADPQSSTLSTRIFNGEMDDVAVFNYALTSAQLNQIYSVAVSGLSLQIQASGTNVTVTWPLGTLYSSPTANGPWSAVSGATSPYTTTLSGGSAFFQVIAAP